MKKVLLISYYWPPAGGAGVQRVLKFSKYLPDFDIVPIILTVSNPVYPITDNTLADEIHPAARVYKAYGWEPFSLYGKLTGKTLEQVSNPGTALSSGQLSTFSGRLASWLRANLFIPDGRIGWIPGAIKKAREIIAEHKPDVIISSGPPHSAHFIGRSLKRTFGIPWIADFRDPWVDIHYNQLLPRTAFTKNLDSRLEKKIITSADTIVTTSHFLSDLYKKRYQIFPKSIPNGFDEADFSDEKPEMGSKKITIRHIGTLPEPSIPFGLLEALTDLENSSHLDFGFVGTVHESFKKEVRQMGLENCIRFRDYVPYKEAAALMQSSDALLLIIPDVEKNPEAIIPGKLFNYLGSGRPVICIGNPKGDAGKILNQCGFNLIFGHHEHTKMSAFFHGLNKELLAGFKGNPSVISSFSRKQQAGQLAKIIHSLSS